MRQVGKPSPGPVDGAECTGGEDAMNTDCAIVVLRRRVRNLEIGLLLALLALSGCAVFGATGAEPVIVKARRVEVVDEDGRTRVVLGEFPSYTEDGRSAQGLDILGEDGKSQVRLLAVSGGGAGLNLYDSDGAERIRLSTASGSAARLRLANREEKGVVYLTSGDPGDAHLHIKKATNQTLFDTLDYRPDSPK